MLGMETEIGTLVPGMVADVSVLDLKRGRFALHDNSGERVWADELVTPHLTVRGGDVIAVDSPLVPPSAAYA
jgi:predicted amidohydrolase